MNATQFVDELLEELLADPPPGFTPEYLLGFWYRHSATLEAQVERLLAAKRGAVGARPAPDDPEEADQVGEPTPWDGRKGAVLPVEQVRAGMRVVTFAGEHGEVLRVSPSRDVHISRDAFGNVTQHKVMDVRIALDDGRTKVVTEVWAELASPRRVPPAVEMGQWRLTPGDAWAVLGSLYQTAVNDPGWEALSHLAEAWRSFEAWRSSHPGFEVPNWDGRHWRMFGLKAGALAPNWPDEEHYLKLVPADWRRRYQVGDPVLRLVFGRPVSHWVPDRVTDARGEFAVLESGTEIPLYYLRHPEGIPLEPPTYVEGLWLVELHERLELSRPLRTNDAAKAVRAYLSSKGVPCQVKKRVEGGYSLTPRSGEWAPVQLRLMEDLLGIRASRTQARIFPGSKEEYVPTYPGGTGWPAGIWLTQHRIADFAPYLAKVLHERTATLTREGLAWLARHPQSSALRRET